MPRGIDSVVVVKKQTAQGTPAVLQASDYALPLRSESLRAQPTVYQSEALRKQAMRDRKLARLGTLDVSGGLEIEATNFALDTLLPLAFPNVADVTQIDAHTGVSFSGNNKGKVYTLSTADLPYATVAVYDGEVRKLFTDMKVSSWRLRADINQLGLFGVDFVGIGADTDGTPVVASVPAAEYGLYFEQAKVEVGDAGGALTEIPVRAFELSVNTNANGDRYRLGSRFRRMVPTGRFDVTGSITVDANSFPGDPEKFYNAVLNAQFLQMVFSFVDPGNPVSYTHSGGSATSPSRLTVKVPFALVEWPEHNISGPDYIEGGVRFTAYADGQNGVSVEHIYTLGS